MILSYIIHRLLPRVPDGDLAAIERQAQFLQGKGWGASTVTAEVAAIADLLGAQAAASLVVVDVGASTGDWTAAALARLPAATVHAFEPSMTAFTRLHGRLGTDPRVVLHQSALGATDGYATLFAPSYGSALGSLTQRRLGHFGISMEAQESVPVQTFSTWRKRSMVAGVDVLKLDVEGHELEILRSMGDSLREIPVIQFEFGGTNIDTRTYWQDFWYLLSGLGFRLLRLSPHGLIPVPRYLEGDEVFSVTNFFAVNIHQ